MTYVASPSYSIGEPARAANLRRCLETARKRLDETSKSSDAQKESGLIAATRTAGWEGRGAFVTLRTRRSAWVGRPANAGSPVPRRGSVLVDVRRQAYLLRR